MKPINITVVLAIDEINFLVEETITSYISSNNIDKLYFIFKNKELYESFIKKYKILANNKFSIFNFKNLYSAFNYAIRKCDSAYIQFILPGTIVSKKTYNFINSIKDNEVGVIILNTLEYFINNNNEKVFKFIKNKIKIDGINETAIDTLSIVSNKIYSANLIKNNNVIFIKNNISPILFFLCLAYIYSNNNIHLNNEIFIYGDFNRNIFSKEENNYKSAVSFIQDHNMIDLSFKEKNLKYFNIISGIYSKLQHDYFYGKIDFVFPYVNFLDENWIKEYNKYARVGYNNDWFSGIARFRDFGLLKYTLRSIDKHMPWINKLHILVMSDSQIPEWINRKTVNFIMHDEFIPKEHLPTFNSNTIEDYLPNLPNSVSNKFIYSNDDLLAFKNIQPEFFYNGERPVYSMNIRNFNPSAPGDNLRLKSFNLILNKPDNTQKVATTQHGPVPYKKAWIKECYTKYKDIIDSSCTKFRQHKNFNQYIYAFFQMMEKVIVNDRKKILSLEVKKSDIKNIIDMDFNEYDFICFNDINDTDKKTWEYLLAKLEKMFPDKSKYEV